MANQPLSLCRVIRIEEGVFKDFIILNKHIVVVKLGPRDAYFDLLHKPGSGLRLIDGKRASIPSGVIE